jgi:dihydrofolate reductase
MIKSLVVAVAHNNAIGGNNTLLWHLPNDLRFFKNLTWGMPIIMGRKTFESIAGKPLPGRLNIVVTKDKNNIKAIEGISIVCSLEEAYLVAEASDCREAFVIGGGDIYQQSIQEADRLYITSVDASFETATVFFPDIDTSIFQKVASMQGVKDEKNTYAHQFETWERVNKS